MTTRVRLTYEDYAALPDDGRRYELHQGELSVTPAPGLDHQEILGNLFVILRNHVNARGLGKVFFAPVDCILDKVTVVQPDLVFVETARLSVMSGRGTEGRIGRTNATSAGAAGVRPGPGAPGGGSAMAASRGQGEGRHHDRPLPCAAVGWWARGGQRGAVPAVGGSVESGTEARAT